MNCECMDYEAIKKSKYPNLLAEVKESGYSTRILATFMEIGTKAKRYTAEHDRKVWDKITGKADLYVNEAFGLLDGYNVDYAYLFSSTLTVVFGKPLAYWRWFDENSLYQKMEGCTGATQKGVD